MISLDYRFLFKWRFTLFILMENSLKQLELLVKDIKNGVDKVNPYVPKRLVLLADNLEYLISNWDVMNEIANQLCNGSSMFIEVKEKRRYSKKEGDYSVDINYFLEKYSDGDKVTRVAS